MQNNRHYLEHVAREEMNHIFATVPKAQEFHTGQWTDLDYYRRHLVETVLRIRLNNEVDAYGLYKIGPKDNKLAQILAQYLAEEYGHENLFMRDIERFGLKKTEVDAIPTFSATDQLIGYLYFSINRNGPLPTMIWNWFVEWYSDNYNKTITQKAAQAFGSEKVKGSLGHIQYDESHDHDDLMWGAVQQAIDGWGDLAKAESYLRNFVRLIGRYFGELHGYTAARTEQAAA